MFSMSSGNLSGQMDIEGMYYAYYRKKSQIHRKVEGGSGLSAGLHPS